MKLGLNTGVIVLLALFYIIGVDTGCYDAELPADPDQKGDSPPWPNWKPCPTGTEVTREQNKDDKRIFIKCCDEDSDVTYYNNNADACRTTKCVSSDTASTTKDICDVGLDKRLYVDNTEINFIETVRDECVGVDGDDNAKGFAAVCCRKNSFDYYSTTLFAAERFEFPHFARVGKYGCGGTIYNEQWVITAAHCVVNEEQHRLQSVAEDGQTSYENCCSTVRLNIIVRDIETDRSYNVEKIVVYPNSSYTDPNSTLYVDSWGDVALLKLEKKIEFGDNVKALKIADTGFDPLKYGDYAILTGFGKTDTRRDSYKMQKANMKIRNKKDVGYKKNEHDQLMFAGGIQKNIVSSAFGQGDSGGPLICRGSDGNAVLCGVVSFLASWDGCLDNLDEASCLVNAYNDVQFFNEWIQSEAGGQENAVIFEKKLFGEPVGNMEYLSHVHINSSDGGDSCGGTLIAEDVVLTIASCVMDKNGNYRKGTKVVTGVTDLKNGDKSGKSISIKTMAVMEGFGRVARGAWDVDGGRRKRMASLPFESWKAGKLDNSKIQKDNYYKNNLVLLKLKEKVQGGAKIAKIAKTGAKTGDLADEIAFPMKSWGTAGKGTKPLSKREFKILSKEDCQERMDRLKEFGYKVELDDIEMCGVENYSGGSMCDRELGGGVYCKGDNGDRVLCGVQIFRLCEFNIPNEFIDVTKVKDWINDGLKQLKNVK